MYNPKIKEAIQVDPSEGYYDGPYSCPECSMNFMLDLRVRYLSKVMTCPCCAKQFRYPSKLNKRLLAHLEYGERNETIDMALEVLYQYIDEGKFRDADQAIKKLEETLDPDDPELVRARAFMTVMSMDEAE